jgi:hypothetical protein
MSDSHAKRSLNWIQEKIEEAKTSPIGQRLAQDGDWTVTHTRGGCLAWHKPIPGGYAWICDAEQGLGDTLDEPYSWGIYDETHDHSLDCGGGVAPNLDEALRCIGDPTEWEKALRENLSDHGDDNTTHGQHRIAAMRRLWRLKEHVPLALDESIRIAPEHLNMHIEVTDAAESSNSVEPRDGLPQHLKKAGE